MSVNKKKKVLDLIMIVSFLAVLIIFFLFMNYLKDNKENEEIADNLKDLIGETVATGGDATEECGEEEIEYVDFSNILAVNLDFVGWLQIQDTAIDYPVVYRPDDTQGSYYYLKRDFYGNSNSGGTLFVDYRNNVREDNNIIIYGHKMRAGTMFAALLKYEDEEFYKEHKYISFNTIYGCGTYEVIAAFRTNVKSANSDDFKYYDYAGNLSAADYEEYVGNCKNLTSYDTADAEDGERLITLSTCAYHTYNGRFVVVAKQINQKNSYVESEN